MRTRSITMAVLALLVLGAATAATAAGARGVTYSLDIPSQSLNEALQQLALASQHKLFYRSELAEGKTSPALKGEFTTEQALQALLAGTNLTYEITPSAVVQIRDTQSPPMAGANTTSSADASRGSYLEEVVVTAEKREANLQSVPVAITAVTASRLALQGGTTAVDLPALVPGLVFPRSFGSGLPYLRGFGNQTGGGENAVAMYLDGIFLSAPTANILSFNNIDQVEVLRGPQGTLFGRNAIGGLIHVITKAPSHEFQGDASIGYGRFDDLTGNFYVTGGLNDNVTSSLAIYGQNRSSGWGTNLENGAEVFKSKSLGIQNKWLFTDDTEKLKVLVNLVYNYIRQHEGPVPTVPPELGVPAGLFPETGYYDTRTAFGDEDGIPFFATSQYLASVKASYEFDWGTISNQASFASTQSETEFSIFPFANSVSAALPANWQALDGDNTTYANELQIQSLPSSELAWIAGLFYMNDRTSSTLENYSLFNGIGAPPLLSLSANGGNELNSYAAFGQATYPIFPSTRLTFGARYTVDEKDLKTVRNFHNASGAITVTQNQNSFINATPAVDPTESWSKVTYRASLAHDFTPDFMGYVSFNTGFKGGQFNTLNPSNPAVLPETANTYAGGFKSQLFDDRVRLNVEAFYSRYENIQLRATIPPSVIVFTYNAASADIRGVDVDFEFGLTSRLSLFGAFEYLHAFYDDFQNAPCVVRNPAGGVTPIGLCDASGNRMIRAPEYTGNINVQYTVPLPSGSELSLRVGDAYNSGFPWDPDQVIQQESYHNVTASAAWTSPDERIAVRVWGKNLADEIIWNGCVNSGPVPICYPSQPVMYGAAIDFHF